MLKNYKKKGSIATAAIIVSMLLLTNGLKAQEACAVPDAVTAANLGVAHTKLSWAGPETNPADGYEWQVKIAGSEDILQSGTTPSVWVLINQLQPATNYVINLRALCSNVQYSEWTTQNVTTLPLISNLEGQIGNGTNANAGFDASYAPIMYNGVTTRNGSVANVLYTAAEIEGFNMPVGASITSIAFEKLNNARGGDEYPDMRMRIFAKNSATVAPLSTATTYGDILAGHTEVMDNPDYILPATIGWINFPFGEPFEYTGEGLEVATATYQNGQTAQFSSWVIWQYTSGYSDHIIGAWPINSVPMSENLILSHNIYRNRPNIKIFYNVSNVATTIEAATLNNAAAEITENQGSLQLSSAIIPEYVSQATVWEIVSGSEYATISQEGVVSAFANGTVVVRAITADNSDLFDDITITITNQAPCTVSFPGSTEPITLVQFAGIDNTSSAIAGTETPAQENFEEITAQVTVGEAYAITVKGNTNGNFVHHVTAYADWNRNNSFEDEGEEYTIGTLEDSTGEDAIAVTGTITVPENAPLGLTKIRIIKKFNTQAPSCNTVGYGQAEDYSVNVNPEVAGTGGFTKNTISIYPNPTGELLNIQSQEKIESAELFNSLGQSVLKSNSNQLNLSQLQNGIYILKAVLSSGRMQTFKVFKK